MEEIFEPLQREAAEIDFAFAVDDLLCKRLADGGRVLESMARTRRRDHDAIVIRVNVDDEVRIRRCRVQATCRGCASIGNARQAAVDIIFVHGSRFLWADWSLHVIWIGDRCELLGRDLDRFAIECRKPIDAEFTVLGEDPNEDGEPRRRKYRAAIFPDGKPVHELAVYLEQRRVGRRQKTCNPGSGGDDDLSGGIGAAAG